MPTVIDFVSPLSVEPWLPVNDRVMGGCSSGRLRHDAAGFAVFEGVVSPDNGGGFASLRHPSLALGSAATRAYRLEVLGDGKRYKWNLRTDQTFDGVQYQAEFQPPPGQWTTVDLPVAACQARFRGRAVAGAPALEPERVRQVGLMVADRQWGPFALCVRRIECVESPGPQPC